MLAQAPGLDILPRPGHGIPQHGLDLGVGEPIGRLDLDLGLDPARLLHGGHIEQPVRVDLEADPDARRAGRHRRDPAQLETGQRTAVRHQFPLPLEHMHGHGGLPVLEGGEFLGPGHGDGGVAGDDLFHQAAHGLQAEGQGDDVQQQQFIAAPVAGQDVRLEGGADGDHPVGVQLHQRWCAEELAHSFPHPRHAGGAADHDHIPHRVRSQPGIPQATAAGRDRPGDERVRQGVEGRPIQLALPVGPVGQFDAQGRPIHRAQGLFGGAGVPQQPAQGAVGGIILDAGLFHHPARDRAVQVIAAEGGVAARGQYLEHPPPQAQDRDVEGAATKVIDGVDALGLLVQAVGHRRGGGLVQEPEHLEPRQAGGILGGLALGLVEVGGDRDDDARELAPQGRLRPGGEDLEDLRRDLHRAEVPTVGADAWDRGIRLDELVRQTATQAFDVVQPTTDEALDGGDRVQGIIGGGGPRRLADDYRILAKTRHGRQQVAPVRIRQGSGDAAAHGGYQGVGGPQVDTRRQTVLVGHGGPARFRDL